MNAPEAVNPAIVFIHRGGDAYLACSLTQARQSNPDADIYLVGDRYNRGFPGIIHLEWREFTTTANEFGRIYRHRSTNSREFELFCIQRWLVLNEMLRQLELPGCLYLDSDVLLYEEARRMAPCLKEFDLSPSGAYFSPHFMFLHGIRALELFRGFVFRCYTDESLFLPMEARYEERRAAGMEGGICDMALLRECARLNALRTVDISSERGGFLCDVSMANDDGGFKMRSGAKHIEWREGLPWAFHVPTNRWIKFGALHFQGPSKGHIFRHMRLPSLGWRTRYLCNRVIAKGGKYWQKTVRLTRSEAD